MINISESCLQALKDDAVQHAEIQARLLNGKALTLTDADLILNGFEVENHAVCGEQLEVGSMTAAVLKLTLDNEDGRFNGIFFAGAELTVKLLIPLADGTSYTIPYGVYTIDEQPRTWSTIEIEAFDNMVKLDIPFDAVGLSGVKTLQSLVRAGLRKAGLNGDGSENKVFPAFSFRGGLDVTKIKSENPITWRQVLMWCCQCVGVCGFADGNGYIHFGFYKKYTPDILQTESEENIETESGAVLLIDGAAEGDFPLPPSLRFIDNMHLDESDCILTGHQFKVDDKLYPENAVMDYGILTENNLVFASMNPNSRISTANTVNQLLAGFTYRPFACDIISMPHLQLLDSIDYYENGQHYHSIVTNYTFRLNGFMNIEAKAKSQVQKGWASLGALTPGQQAIIDSVSRKVDRTREQLSDYENALLLFNEKMLRSMGLYKTAVNDPNGGIITYFHNMETLENSDTIYMFGASGFAWTQGGWNNGNPVWHYGFTDTGDAIFNEVQAYKISADLIQTGYLRSQNGASWISLDDGTFSFRTVKDRWMDVDTGEVSYTYDEKLSLDKDGTLGVYGELRSIQSNYSAFIGSDLDYDAEVDGIGIPIFRITTDLSRKDKDAFQIADSSFEDYDAIELRLNSKDTKFACEENLAYITNSTAYISTYNGDVQLSTYSHPYVWINYYEPQYGLRPTAYKFGNGTEGKVNGGFADIRCGKIIVGGDTVWNNTTANITGNAYVAGDCYANNYYNNSTRDIKKNIQPQKADALSLIKLLKFYSYDYDMDLNQTDENSEPKQSHIEFGLVAEESPQEIKSEDGKAINLYEFISLTAKSVQELSKKVEALEQKIIELEAENHSLRQ